MEKLKDFIKSKKKIVIPIAILIVILLAVGIYFAASGSDDKQAPAQQTEETEKGNDIIANETKNETADENKQESDNSENSNATSESDVNVSDSNPVSSGSEGQTGKPSTGGNSNSSGQTESKPAHSHSWTNHTATRQVWVSNMVEVPVYEEQKVQVGTRYIFAHDGYVATSSSEYKAHAMELIKAGLPDNYRTEPVYDTKTVQTGTKQEDHGSYKTETYVDYVYCSGCGQRK